MHVRAKRRQHFHSLHPAILLESCRHNLVCVFDVAARRQRHALRHFQNQIRLRDAPTLGPTNRRRGVVWITGGRSCGGPSCERRDLSLRERRIIREVPNVRIRKPRRHRFVLRRGCNRCCIRPRLLIRFESHRRDAVGAMTNLAPLLQNRQHVAVKNRRARSSTLLPRVLRRILRCSLMGQAQQNQQKHRHSQRHLFSYRTEFDHL